MLIFKVPPVKGEIVKVTNRIGPIQNSVFGSEDCLVENNLEFADRAYTNLELKIHTDNIYMSNPSG